MTLTPFPDARATPDGDVAEQGPPADVEPHSASAESARLLDETRALQTDAGSAAAEPAAGLTPPVEEPASPREPRAARADGGARAPRLGSRSGPAPDRGFPRAERPGNVPAPQHHHLPGWVRRDFAKARPALADLLGLLHGDERQRFQQRVDELTAGITSGKFSLAWQYPALIDEGRKAFDGQRTHIAEAQRMQRQLESARRRAGDRLRDAGDLLTTDATARLARALRQASDLATIAEIEAEADRALSTARSTGSRRRDREIERTRHRLLRTLPKAALVEEPQTESWQDVLRRFAQEQEMAQDLGQEQAAPEGGGAAPGGAGAGAGD